MSDVMNIGQAAQASGVSAKMIRHYEHIGLLPAPDRTERRRRIYAEADLHRLAFIRHARDLGLTIDAIRALIELSQHPERPCHDADRIAAEQLATVRRKIDRLRKLEAELERITSHCHSDQIRDCYVIRALANHDLCHDEHD